ncbi:hypothetical protein HELRODRAFT_189003 [Helobdella robusta]|uniref:Fibronectin type-III domain-containing protein n=1 Tax=Helobdella robusta TaxID=6412 RepID=T1FQJ8_HELRO|nr:hypothetical protein HELRODRAFT_189003 [Helobdella robusta]ESN99137.1 hypothetical protein HELRODRAFT_189003 [Helobdella robusta]
MKTVVLTTIDECSNMPTNVKIDWEKFVKQRRLHESSCPLQYFEVKFKYLPSKHQIQSWKVGTGRHYKIINNVPEGSLFAVQVVAHLCSSQNNLATKWHKNQKQDQEEFALLHIQPPSTVHAVSYQNNIFVKWSVQESVQRSSIEGFIVSYGEEVPDLYFKYVSAEHRNLTLSDLKYSTKYVVGVRSFVKQHRSDAVYRNIATKERSSFGMHAPKAESSFLPPPTNLLLKTLSSRSVYLQWSDPSLYQDQKISDERFYAVYYSSIDNQKNYSIVVKAHQVTIYDLEPNQWYKFKVRTGKGILVSPFTDEIQGKTLQEEAHFPPLKLSNDQNSHKKISKVSRNSKVSDNNKPHKGSTESKTKRHQKFPKTPKTVKHSNQADESSAYFKQPIHFVHDVQIRVNAYISWPETFTSVQGSCGVDPFSRITSSPSPASSSSQSTYNYLFRYKLEHEDDNHYIVSNHTLNYKLLENLSPMNSYKYQIRYLNGEGMHQPWSQASTLHLPFG